MFMDLARFLRVRREIGASDDGQLAFEGFYSYLLPQFEGIEQATGEELLAELKKIVGSDQSERLRQTLNAVLGLEIAKPGRPGGQPGEDAEFEPDLPELAVDDEPE
jgi:hypothetical protein